MQFNLECLSCTIKQIVKVMDMMDISQKEKEHLMKASLAYLSEVDFSAPTPFVMGKIWGIITKNCDDKDIYRKIKNFYNTSVMEMESYIKSIIDNSDDRFNTALRVAISGNLIDFAAKHTFDINLLKSNIEKIVDTKLAIDNSRQLYQDISVAKQLLYLGDNCGEICLDKIFIEYIKKEFPNIKIYFAVRGKAVINDVVIDDADAVSMGNVAYVISNGDGSAGTVLENVSTEFKNIFDSSDVIISKGQGNFESLGNCHRENVYYLFMAKCKYIWETMNVEPMSILCAKY